MHVCVVPANGSHSLGICMYVTEYMHLTKMLMNTYDDFINNKDANLMFNTHRKYFYCIIFK